MVEMSEKKGIKQERELVNWLFNRGYMAVRVAGSGGGTKRPAPDIICGDGVYQYVIELKSSNKDTIYLKDEQKRELEEFAQGFGATPLFCANFSYLNYVFVRPDKLSVTDGMNYKITRAQAKIWKINDLRPPVKEIWRA